MTRFPQSRKLFCAVLALALGVSALGCSQERPAPVVVAPDLEKSVPANAADAAPVAPTAIVGEIAEPVPAPIEDGGGDPLPPLDASCAVDSDCEVKEVGNCCGRMPACVNRAARPHAAAAIQRECERTGTSSICGFQELSGCRCESGRCLGVSSASGGGDVR